MAEAKQDGTQAPQGRQRVPSPRALLGAFALLLAPWTGAGGAAAQGEPPADTFRDAATRELVEQAIAVRDRGATALESYEATLRQRIYAGLTAFRFRRERGLFAHERIARIRWSASGEQAIRWIGARTAVPIVGIDSSEPDSPGQASLLDDNVTVEIGADASDRQGRRPGREAAGGDNDVDDDEDLRVTAEDYLDETDFPGFDFDPAADRLVFGDDWALHPLADTALVHYRYSLGDTLRVELPANDRAVVLYELRVEPRRPDFELMAGSLWIDSASASVARATYRPARPWNMRLDEPEAANDVPGWVGPIEAEISYITVESSLQEFEHWLPRRFAFRGEGRAGGLLRVPVTLEWSVGDYVVNEPPRDIPVEGDLPEGWRREVISRTDDDGVETTYTVVVPTTEELIASSELSPDFARSTPVTFSDRELDELAGELGGLVPVYRPFPPRVVWGLEEGQLRYNRVEGLSVGASTEVSLTNESYVALSARVGTGDRVPNVVVALGTGPESSRWVLEGYHRLASMNDDDDPFTLANSAKNLVLGGDRGEYYRATGGALEYRRSGTTLRALVGGFVERQRAVKKTTDFFVGGVITEDTLGLVLAADDLDLAGGRTTLRWSLGTDPRGWIHTGRVSGEAGFGDATYQRADASLSLAHPVAFDVTGAVEVAAGTSWGDLPTQRAFFLGGSRTLRGFYINEAYGPAFWRARVELATGIPGARLSLFSDLGWVGARADFGLRHPLAGAGVGVSVLDGLLRADLTRAFRGVQRWKWVLYLDGLL